MGKSSDYTALCGFRRQRIDPDTQEEPTVPGVITRAPATNFVPAEVATKAQKRLRPVTRYDGWLLQRFELGTPYPDIVERVTGLFQRDELKDQSLVIDATGVGEPVVDMFRRARTDPVKCPKCYGYGFLAGGDEEICLTCTGHGRIKLQAKIRPIYIRGGVNGDSKHAIDRDGFRVSKIELISVLEVLLQAVPGRMWVNPNLRDAKILMDEFSNFRVKKRAGSVNDSLEAWREKDHDDLVLACAIALWFAERGQQKFNVWV